jgi:diaminopimelate epimerase
MRSATRTSCWSAGRRRADARPRARLCDTAHGIGATASSRSSRTTGRAREIAIWNPDGSDAEMSGTGAGSPPRGSCARRRAREVEIVDGGRHRPCRRRPGRLVRQEIGDVAVGTEEALDLAGERITVTRWTSATRTPSCCRDVLSRDDLLRLGPAIETHPRFPGGRTSSSCGPGPRRARALVWERGAGETRASGSSAVAVAAAAVARGWCDSPVRGRMPAASSSGVSGSSAC